MITSRTFLKAAFCGLTLISFFQLPLKAQGPYCVDQNCTANDIKNPAYFLGDSLGNPIASITCDPGQEVSNVYLWITFEVTATNRYDVNVVGDVLVSGVFDHSFDVCLGDFGSGIYTRVLEQITWPCGAPLLIANTLFAWDNQDGGDNPDPCNMCPDVPSKCDRFGDIDVAAPLVADFLISSECIPGIQFEVFTFTNNSTGGLTPYANYNWDFGTGANPTPSTTSGPGASGPFEVEYDSPGMRSISLTVTDAAGISSIRTKSIDVLELPTVSLIAEDQEICEGGSVTLSAMVSSGENISYQWQQFLGGVWTDIGSDQPTYTTPLLSTGSYLYRVLAAENGGCPGTSNTVTVTVVGDPSVTLTAAESSICEGGSAMLTANVTGGTGTTHYQWQQLIGGVWTDVGTDQNTFTSTALTLGTYDYRVVISQDAGCNVISAGQTITVVTDPTVDVTASDLNICEGGTVTLTANVAGGAGTTNFQWQYFTGGVWTNVGTNQNTFTTPELSIGSYQYRVEIAQNSGCSATSALAEVTVVGDPTVSVLADASTICEGGMATLTANVNGGTGTTHYQWQEFIGGVWTDVGSDQDSYTTPALNIGTYDYRVIISQNAGCNATSAGQTITVVNDPTVDVTANDLSICEGGTVTLTADVTGGAGTVAFQWQQFLGGVWTDIGSNQDTYTTPALSVGTYLYRVQISQNSGCDVTSTTAEVTVVGDPTVSVSADANTICTGGMAILTANVSGGTGTSQYQWQFFTGGVWTNVGTDQPTYTTPALNNGTYDYRVVLSQDAGCNATSAGQTITVVDDPTVDVTADDFSICEGGTVTFTAAVNGGAGIVAYQWQQFIGGVWTDVGSNQNTYTTPALSIGNYQYRVEISQNSGCFATSATAEVTVVGDPTVSVSADANTICAGGSATIMANVTGGTGTTHYQWQQFLGGVWTDVGSDQDSYTTSALSIGTYNYRVVISQDAGCNVTSASETITVVDDPTVDVTADDLSICEGGTVTLTANVSGGAGTVNYQWQQFIGGVWTDIGSNQNTYTTPSLSIGTYQYRVEITQNSGCFTTSSTAEVSVVGDPTVSVLADDNTICDGGMAVLTANVSGGTGVTHYQWQQFIGGVWTDVGSDQNTYTSPSLSIGSYNFRVIVSQDAGCNVTSAGQTITVVDDPTVDVTADDFSICEGGTVTFTAAVNGGAGTVVYQWQQFIGGVWTDVGSNQNTYTTPALSIGSYQYRVEISQNSGCFATSATAEVTVVGDPTVSVSADANTICAGGSATITANVTGGTGTTHYQWQQFLGGVWTDVGSDQDSYTTSALSIGTYNYRVVISQDAGCNVTSASETITVVDDPTVDVTADDLSICEGGTVTLTANVSGGAGTVNYQWQQFIGGVWTDIGSNQDTYTTPSLSIGTYQYRVEITQNSGCFTTSSTAEVSVVGDPTVSVSADENTICDGGMAVLTANVSGGTGVTHYQWQQFIGGVWTEVGSDQNTYTSPSLSIGSYNFRVIVSQDAGCNATSAGQTITVVEDPTVDASAENAIVCEGGTATFTATVNGGAGATNYQWQQFIGGVWTDVGPNQAVYTTGPLNLGNHQFRVIITQNSGCSATSATIEVNVIEGPSITVSADENSICDGGMAALSAEVTGGTGSPSYQWQQFIGGVWVDVGTDQSTYTSGPLSVGSYNYRVILAQGEGCEATSASVLISVVDDPEVLVIADDASICEGGSATLTAVVNGGAGTTHYQWQYFSGGVWNDVGGDNVQYTTNSLSIGSHTFRVIITQNSGCSTTSADFLVSVVGDPTVSVLADANSICIGGTATMTANVSGGTGATHYQWQQFVGGVWTNIGSDQNTYTTPVLALGSYDYRVIVSQDEGCNATSASATISVVEDPTVSVSANDDEICEGGTVTLTANINGGAGTAHYQWQQFVGGVWTNVGGDQPTYTTPGLAIGTHLYRVQITQNSGCSATSASASITVVDDPTVDLLSDQTNICDGGTVTFTAVVSGGTGTTHYQWQQRIGGIWTNVGSDQPTYVTDPLTIGNHLFRVMISQDAGCNVISFSQTVSVVGDPTVTVDAGDTEICVGGTATFSANVSGGVGATHYQWQHFTGGIWTDVGTDQSSYTTPALNTTGSYLYRVLVTQNNGCSDTSSDIVVNVSGDPTVTVTASETDICDGGTATLTANVSGGVGTTSYQWQFFDGGVWTNVGTNQDTYTTPVLFAGIYQYRVIVNQNAGCNATSASTTINVANDPVINVDAGETDICAGATATFNANVTGGAGTPHYQWQFFTGGVWTNVGSDQPSYTTPALTIGTYLYRVMVTQNSGCSSTSAVIEVNVTDGPTVDVSADANDICDGGMATLTAVVSGGSGTNNYQWQFFSGGVWVDVGANQSTYTTPALTVGSYQYRVLLDQNSGCQATSASEVINVVDDPSVSVDADDTEICEGGMVTLTANVSGGAGTTHYQWQFFTGGVWTDVGADQNTYTTPALNIGTFEYRVLITQNSGCSTTSGTSTITVVGDPTVTVTADANTICDGGSATLTAFVTGGTGPINYQWQQLIGGVWTNVGTDQNTYNTGALSIGTYEYRVLISQDAGCSVASASELITVVSDPTVDVDIEDDEICAGGIVTLTANVAGGAGTTHYQWQYFTGGIWTDVGTDQNTYTTPALTIGTHLYRVLITQNSGCSATSANAQITVVGDPEATVTAEENEICDGGMAVLTANVSGGTGTTHYQWQYLDAGVWTNVGTDQNTYTTPALTTGTYQYRVEVTQDAGCLDLSPSLTITVNDDPGINVTATDNELCDGESTTLTANVTGGAGNTHYQWQYFTGGVWTDVGTDQNTYTTPVHNPGTHNYRVIVTQNSGCETISDVFIITVHPNPSANADPDQSICSGGSIEIGVNPSGGTGPYSYLWSTGATTQTITVSPVVTTIYSVTVTDANMCASAEETIQITVYPETVANAGPDQVICLTETAILSASGGVSYAWSTGETTQSISVSPASTTVYSVTVTDANGCTDTDEVQVTVNTCIGVICGNVSDDVGNPVSNVELNLYADTDGDGNPDGSILFTTFTDGETGNYCFEDAQPGVYVIVEVQPPNYDNVSDYDHTPDPDGDDSALGWNNQIPVVLDPNEGDFDNNFIEDPHLGNITGHIEDEYGSPVPGVTLQLYGDLDQNGVADGPVQNTVVSDAQGDYEFVGVEPGFYVVVEVQPANYTDISDYDHTPDPDGDDQVQGPDNDIPVVVTPGELDEDNIFIENANPGIICGNVSDNLGNPISNVTLQLFADTDGDGNPDGAPILSTQADGETGNYCFEDMEYGNYVIVEIQPPNYDSESDYDHTPDPDGDDSAQGPDNDIPVTLDPGEADFDNNFIEDPHTGTISGNVSEDTGLPISGVLIELYFDADADGIPDGAATSSQNTNASGDYLFDGVEPGNYLVIQTQPANYFSISDYDTTPDPDGDDSALGPNEQIPVVVDAGEDDQDNDFLEDPYLGAICGTVTDDIGNPLSNVVLELYADTNGDGNADGTPVASTTSDGETGLYCFEDVEPGTYVVVELQPPNYDSVSDYDHTPDPDGDDSAQGPDNDIPVVLEAGEGDIDNNFIEDPHTGTISGNVSEDTGLALAGIIIELYFDVDANGIPDGAAIASQTTNASGDYLFDGVEPGNYLVIQTQPAFYFSISDYDTTPDPDGDDSALGPNEQIPVVVDAGEDDQDNDFLEDPYPGAICGTVTDDIGNPLSNVVLELYADTNGDGNADGAPITSTTSDGETGLYCFEDVEPGTYVVVEIQPPNYDSVSDYDHTPDPDGDDSAQGPDNDIPVVLEAGEGDIDNNFIEDPHTGTISGNVSEDNGLPLAGIIIELYFDVDADGIPDGAAIASQTTNASGDYLFDGVEPGNYLVIQTQPAFYFSISDYDTTPDPDGDDSALGPNEQVPVVVDAGEDDQDNDFLEDPYPGAICGTVTDDIGNPLSNVVLELYADTNGDGNADGAPIASTTSDGETGLYCFEDVEPGTYVVVEIQPPNYDSVSDYDHTPDPDGDDSAQGPDNDIPVVLEAGEGDIDNNFIEDPHTGTISGNVSEDTGLALAGIIIELYFDVDANGIPDGAAIASQTTNASGNYLFDGVEPGNYLVIQTQPAFYFSISDYDTTPDPDGDDSALGPNEQIPVFVDAGEDDQDNDFLEDPYPGAICGVVEDELGNPLSNVVFELYADTNGDGNPDGGVLTSTTSDGETGLYCFEDVEPGDYVIVQVQPTGYESMSDYDHSTGVDDPDGDDSGQGPDNDIPVTIVAGEGDIDNNFIEIGCAGIPEITGNDTYYICDGESVVFEAINQPLAGETYTWDFGDGASPATATGTGPFEVTYTWTESNQDPGAAVILTITKPNCPTQSGQVATVFVSPIPDPTIDAETFDLCQGLPREFQPLAPEIPGAIYTWTFGVDASPGSAVGYGPHAVTYSSNGLKTVKLVVNPNYPVLASCPDSSEIQFEVVTCLSNISGIVRTNADPPVPIASVLISLYTDNNTDGEPDDLNNPVEVTLTSSQGQYSFNNISAGNYVLYELQPSGGYFSVQDVDISEDGDLVQNLDLLDDLIPVTLLPGESDFGNHFIETNDQGSISGTVYEDLNMNNALDFDEGLAGVKIWLYADIDQNGEPDGSPLDSAFTNTVGNYIFPLVAEGDYVVVEEQPAGYSSIEDIDPSEDGDNVVNVNTSDDIIPVTVDFQESDADNDFIELDNCLLEVMSEGSEGTGTLAGAIECAEPGDTITFHFSLGGMTIYLDDPLIISEDVVIINELVSSITIQFEGTGGITVLPGVNVEIHNLNIVGAPSGDPMAILNQGTLLLNDVLVLPYPTLPPLTTETLIRNESILNIEGNTTILNDQ